MINTQDYAALPGKTVKNTDGDKIGKVEDVYASTEDAHPTFITVSTGMFGTKASFVPVADASIDGDDLVVPYTKDQVKDAPHVDTDEELTADEEDRLYSHYNLASGGVAAGAATGPTTGPVTGTERTVDADARPATDTPLRDGDDASMTRSEETLDVDVQKRETGRARLAKHVVTEQQQVTVPVTREEVRVVREPITDADASAAGTELTDDEASVTLTEEVPVVTTESRPVERVSLDTETVTEEETVRGEVRKEVIDTEGVEDRSADGR